jgi:hypothetical protein
MSARLCEEEEGHIHPATLSCTRHVCTKVVYQAMKSIPGRLHVLREARVQLILIRMIAQSKNCAKRRKKRTIKHKERIDKG